MTWLSVLVSEERNGRLERQGKGCLKVGGLNGAGFMV